MNFFKKFILIIFIIFTFYTTHKVKREILFEREYKEEIGKEAYNFNLKNLEDKEVSLEKLKGSAVILVFFATWCGPCRMELERIKEQESCLYNYNVKLFLVSKEEKEIVLKFMEENGFTFDVLFDKDGKAGKEFNVKYIPKTVIIDDKGKIIFSKVGAINSVYTLTSYLPYNYVVPNKERKLYKEVDKILDSIQCPCSCGKTILNCDCKNCDLAKKRENIKYYAARLLDKEKFKKEQVIQILKWKYIENKEKKNDSPKN